MENSQIYHFRMQVKRSMHQTAFSTFSMTIDFITASPHCNTGNPIINRLNKTKVEREDENITRAKADSVERKTAIVGAPFGFLSDGLTF